MNHYRSGLAAIGLISVGQLLSLLGTGCTQFALALWAWQISGSATTLAIVAVASLAPMLLLSPIAGVFVDRWNRKVAMLLGDVAAGIATSSIFILYATGNLQIWHLIVSGLCAGAFQSLQWPAYSAAISTMVAKEQFGRANGMLSLAEAASGVAAPLLAGVFIGLIGINGILLFDLVTFGIAILTLLIVHVPQPIGSEANEPSQHSFWQDCLFGFRYIFQRAELMYIQLVLLATNSVANFAAVVLTPMILARTENNTAVLDAVLSAGSVGTLVGGIVMSTWGGPKRHIHGVLLGCMLSRLLGMTVIGLGRSLPIWAIGAGIMLFFSPVIGASNQAIWQTKVLPEIQGRVFAARRLIAAIAISGAMFLAGPIADSVFEPAMRGNGLIAMVFQPLVGSGPGTGMAAMLVISGLLLGVIGLIGYSSQAIRQVETRLPDMTADDGR